MPTTEIVVCPLKAGSAIGDAENEASAVLRDVMQTISRAEGCLGIRFGMQVENGGVLEMMIDWETIENHHAFMKQDHYQPFLERFGVIADGKPQFWHVDFTSAGGLEAALSAPVTEVCTCYFHGQPQGDYLERAQQFADAIEEQRPEGYRGIAFGTTHEDIECKGVKGRAVVITIGWASVDAHTQARQGRLKQVGRLLREGPGEIDMHHVMLLGFVAD